MEFLTASVIALLIVIICMIMVHCFPHQRQRATEDIANRVPEQRGLDISFLRTLRIIQFDPERSIDGLECAICLSKVNQGEKIRLLPKCGHGFHMECVDMWFHSHSTCPVCRKPIIDQSEMSSDQQGLITVLVDGQEANSHHQGSNLEQASSSSSSLEMYNNNGRPDISHR